MTDVQLIAVLVVLFLSAVFLAAAEASLLRVPRVRVAIQADAGDHRAQRLLDLIDELPRVMNTVLLAVLLVQIGAATVSGVFAERNFGGLGITITSVVLTLVLFVYAEAIPKTYAVSHPLLVARLVARPVATLTWVMRPLVAVLVWFADLQAPGIGIASRVGVSEDELRRLAAEAASVGEIEETDAELVERVFELGDARVDEILVPRIDVVAVASSCLVKDALEKALTAGHRRLPVYDDDLDHISGVVRLRDLVAVSGDTSVAAIANPPLVVPESKRVIELLREMQAASLHLAVAIDEHGGTAGIVTIEDVVAELLGEVADEGEARRPGIRRTNGLLVVDARVDVTALGDALGAPLPEGDYNTVGGLIIDAAGRIPAPGETIRVAGHDFRVVRGSQRRVHTVEVS